MPEELVETVDITSQNDETEIEGNSLEDDIFNPDTLFSEEDGEEELSYQFGDYDLSKYKDVLDFSDSEMVEEFNQYAQKYAEKGFNQEQIEFILDEKIAELNERENRKEKKSTQKEIKERLQNSLTKEEIRNYRATTNFVKGIVDGTEFEDKLNEIIQNPTLVKLFHNAYKKSMGSTTNIGSVSKKKEKQIRSMSYEEASDKLMEAIGKGIADEKFVRELRNSTSDTESLDELLKALNKI